jgi:hypothetical protein
MGLPLPTIYGESQIKAGSASPDTEIRKNTPVNPRHNLLYLEGGEAEA